MGLLIGPYVSAPAAMSEDAVSAAQESRSVDAASRVWDSFMMELWRSCLCDGGMPRERSYSRLDLGGVGVSTARGLRRRWNGENRSEISLDG